MSEPAAPLSSPTSLEQCCLPVVTKTQPTIQRCSLCKQLGHKQRTCPQRLLKTDDAAPNPCCVSPLLVTAGRSKRLQAKLQNPLLQASFHNVGSKQIRAWVVEYLKHERIQHEHHALCTFGNAATCAGTAELLQVPCMRMPMAPLDGRQRNVLDIRPLQPDPMEDPACANLMKQHMGMFTRVKISKGQLITEFVFKKWVSKKPRDGTMEQCYCVAVRCRSKHGKVYRYGIPDFDSHRGSKGLAHRCNHVCNPALGNVELVQQEGELGSVAEAGSQPTEQRPKVFIAALRDIARGEELVYNYSGIAGPLEECETCFCLACRKCAQS